ncbi:sulfatase [Wenzhouxiangella sp. XN201]|uniref:sulfatase n=1 Tax=Wenzhouxiangella sp. XN201 TaxID=2710755 RepID=UPI0013CC250C|nr:sulfatase [Wenzhouxiangella sp. XN201]NEZ04131.1 sulfatase [Wenzhouxiangella sp. XN201]
MKTNGRFRPGLLLGIAFITVFLAACSEDDAGSPNIVLITIDTLRADRLGAYGYDKNLTPNLDRLAESGVVFERAVTPVGTTWPAHASMLTGLYPRYHGLRRNGLELDEEIPVVTELLSKSGYSTASFVSYKGMHFRGRLDRGFEVVSDREFVKGDEREPIREGQETTAMALDWIGDQSGSSDPAFLWLHLFEPHSPYDLTEYSREWMEETGYDGFLADGASGEELRGRSDEIVASPEHVAAMNALYDGEIKLADELIGRVLDRLEADGKLKNSIVIVTSDHGQGLGEHGNMGHGPTLREDVLHVPLIIRDFRSDQGGRRVDDTVSMIDLAPTIARAALEIDLPGVQGRSLMTYLSSQSGEDPEREIFAEIRLWHDMDEVPDWYDVKSTAIYADGLKFKTRDGETTVFDPRVRPSAERRLDSPEVNEAFLAYLDSLRGEFLAGEIKPTEVELTDHEIETLKSLGYIQ